MTNSEAIDAWATYLAHTQELGFQFDVAQCLVDQAYDAYELAENALLTGREDGLDRHQLEDRFHAVDQAASVVIFRKRQRDRLEMLREQAVRIEQRIGAGVLPL